MNTPSTSLVIIVRNCSQTMATIRGQHLFHSELLIVWRLFEGGGYSRAAAIRGRWLFEGGGYSRAAAIQGRQLFEGGGYSRAAAIRGQRLFEGGGYSRAVAIRGRWLFEGGGYSRAVAIRGRWLFEKEYLTYMYFCNLLHDIQCNHGYISIPHGPRVVHTPVESVYPRGLILDWTEIWVRRYSVIHAVHIL